MNKSTINRGSGSFNELYTETLVLGGTAVTGIATEIDETTNSSFLVTAGTVTDIVDDINDLSLKLDPSSTYYQSQTVMTSSVVDRFFNKPLEFEMDNWDIVSNVLYGVSSAEGNKFKIANTAFTKPGVYFFSITVTGIPSGYIKVMFNDTVVERITQAGRYGYELTVSDIRNDSLRLVAYDLNEEERIVVSEIGLYFIVSRFYEYLEDKIASMATVDANNYLTITRFNEEMEVYVKQFDASAGIFTSELTEHINADNPHHITLDTIGAAPKEHIHSQYVTSSDFTHTLESALNNYAFKSHLHDQYVDKTSLPGIIKEEVGDLFNSVTTIPPMIVVSGPTGKLPNRFVRTEASVPLALLLPSQLNTDVMSTFSSVYGNITTSSEHMISTVMKIFTTDEEGADLPNMYDYSTPLVFRYQFHVSRKIKGYKLYTSSGKVTCWKVITGNNTFRHQIDELTEDNVYYFDEIITTDSITFALIAADALVYGLKIKLLMADEDLDSICITRRPFSVSVPESGSNRLIKMPGGDAEMKFIPSRQYDGIPCYVMGNYTGDTLLYSGTYIRPEYGESRTGVDVYTDMYADITKDTESLIETYIHPVFGRLRLAEGISASDSRLTLIYDKSYDSWTTEDGVSKIVIEQEIPDSNVLLCGYMLNWRKRDMDNIPATWTLMVQGYDETLQEKTVVVDFVEDYFPYYSVEDDDIIYTKTVSLNMHITKLTLTAVARDENSARIVINRFVPYFSEYFYSIPENTMYRGMNKIGALCLGYAVHNNVSGWVPTNLCIGKSVTLPVNDFDITEASSVYTIPNPFFSTDVQVTIIPYKWMEDPHDMGVGQVLSISETEIRIITIVPASYTVTVTRTW